MQPSGFDPSAVTRPAPVLLRYYLVLALFSTVAFPAVFLPLSHPPMLPPIPPTRC